MTRNLCSILATVIVASALSWTPTGFAAGRSVAPSIKSLLSSVASTQKHAKAVRGVGNSTLSGTVKQQGKTIRTYWYGSFVADASTLPGIQAQVAEPLTSKINGTSSKATLNYVAIQKRVAEHLKGRSGWKCSSVNVLNQIPVWTPGTFDIGKTNLSKVKASVKGSGTVSGRAAWKVNIANSIKLGKSVTKNAALFYIDKKNGYLLRWDWSQSTSGPTEHLRLASTVTFSHYGEHLALTMPTCGSGSGGSA